MKRFVILAALLLVVVYASLSWLGAQASDVDALWLVAQWCAHDPRLAPGCVANNSTDAFVIIKDFFPSKPDGFLIVPSHRVTGIEDKQIFSQPYVDFWQYGWLESRTYPGKAAAISALAINSEYGRTQDQLHIHLSCVRSDVKERLVFDPQIKMYPAKPVAMALPPYGNTYEVVKVRSLSGADSPFEIVRRMIGTRGRMGDQSIAVVGNNQPDLYYVLFTSYDRSTKNAGHAEELLDQSCKIER